MYLHQRCTGNTGHMLHKHKQNQSCSTEGFKAKFFGDLITEDFTWSLHSGHIIRNTFTTSGTLSEISINDRFGNCAALAGSSNVVQTAQIITGEELPSVQDVYNRRRLRSAWRSIKMSSPSKPTISHYCPEADGTAVFPLAK